MDNLIFEKTRTTETCTLDNKGLGDHIDDLERVTDRLIKAERELIIGTSILVAFLYVSILWVWLAR